MFNSIRISTYSPHLRKFVPLFLSFPILVFAFFIFQKIDQLFFKPSQFAMESECRVEMGKCNRIDQGRFFFSLSDFKEKPVDVLLKTKEPVQYVFLRKGTDILEKPSTKRVKVSIQDGPTLELQENERHFIPVSGKEFHLTFESLDPGPTKLVIDEIGASTHLSQRSSKMAPFLQLLALLFICFLLSLFIDLKQAKTFGALLFFLLPFMAQLSFLSISLPPEQGHDLKAHFVAGLLQEGPGCNSNYGLYMASSILQGKGPVIGEFPTWCRMPGYGFLLTLAGNPFNILQMAINAVVLQLLLFSFGVAFFYYASLRILPKSSAAAIASLLAILPFHFYQVAIESVMPAVILFSMGMSCFWIEKRTQDQAIPLHLHLFFHLIFAIWFALRTDILPAWGLISLIFYAKRNWKYLFIPGTYFLAIGLSWALFKLPLLKEFCMTTNSVGASMMVGLWEIPHKFIWTVSDGAYFSWMDRVGLSSGTKEASDFATCEVFRFCLIYPIYVLSLVFHKMLFFLQSFGPPRSVPWKSLFLTLPLSLSVFLKYKRFQTLLLSWPILLNVPLFFIFYSSEGRFYVAPTLSLLIASFALLLDLEFYRKIIASPKKTAMILVSYIGFVLLAPMLDEALIKNEGLRYWAPLLDPNTSSLNIVKNEHAPLRIDPRPE